MNVVLGNVGGQRSCRELRAATLPRGINGTPLRQSALKRVVLVSQVRAPMQAHEK